MQIIDLLKEKFKVTEYIELLDIIDKKALQSLEFALTSVKFPDSFAWKVNYLFWKELEKDIQKEIER